MLYGGIISDLMKIHTTVLKPEHFPFRAFKSFVHHHNYAEYNERVSFSFAWSLNCVTY
jgi:hypothetical protein